MTLHEVLAARDPQDTAAALRALIDASPLAPLDAVRPHLCGLTLDLDTTMRLGRGLMAACPRLRPPVTMHPRLAAPSVTVMGTSHVRFFGGHPLFLPLFIGMGPNTLCLTERSFAAARQKVLDNLSRVDPDADLLLDLGAEPFYHVRNILGTRPGGEAEVTTADLACMAATAERYRMLLREVRDRLRGRLILFNVLPTHDPLGNALSIVLNEHARAICHDLAIGFLDIWDAVVDLSNGGLRRDLAAQAYNDDTHLSERAIPIVLAALRGQGVAGTVDDAADAAWRYVYAFPVSPGGDTRIWCEADVIPANAFRSEKVAASFVATAALHVLLPVVAALSSPRILMIGVKDGFLPIMLPPGAAAETVAVCDDAGCMNAARRVAAFAGRDDIAWMLAEDGLSRRSWDMTVVNVHPGSEQRDMARASALLRDVSPGRTFVLGPGSLFGDHRIDWAPEVRRFLPLGNRHLAGRWPEWGLFL